ncbi:hypothetical protein OAK16_03920, partial [Verrucomicrobia bacterium]|nr:hypothetical protein [Verrucomicrobiota bacterium]
ANGLAKLWGYESQFLGMIQNDRSSTFLNFNLKLRAPLEFYPKIREEHYYHFTQSFFRGIKTN